MTLETDALAHAQGFADNTGVPGTALEKMQALASACVTVAAGPEPPPPPPPVDGLPTVGRVARWKASEATTENGAVSAWADDDNGFVLLPVAARPPLVAGVVEFSAASGHRLRCTAAGLTLPQPFTVIVIAKCNGAPVNRAMFDSAAGSYCEAYYRNTGRVSMYAGSLLQGAAMAGPWRCHGFVYNGASSQIRIGKTIDATGNAGSQGLNGVVIGANFAGGEFFDGFKWEIAIYNRALSEDDWNAVDAYAASLGI